MNLEMTPYERDALEAFARVPVTYLKDAAIHAKLERLVNAGLLRRHWSSIGEIDEKCRYDITDQGRVILNSLYGKRP